MAKVEGLVHSGRIRVLKEAAPGTGSMAANKKGPVVYWMFRDQRSRDNWALIHAVDLANRSGAPVAVAFNLFNRFLGAHARQLGFMLRALRELHGRLTALRIPFFLFRGESADTIPRFLDECGASTLVTDFSPLREVRRSKDEICARVGAGAAIHEVDAHNVVPLWAASGKLEYSARTIRAKIHKLLPEYLVEFPALPKPIVEWTAENPPAIDWDGLIADVLREGEGVDEVGWCEPGEAAAMEVLMGSDAGFLTSRLRGYAVDRNNPLKPTGLSGLSPYLHYGHISAQRCALEARAFKKSHPQSVDAFLEELIVRRELADNFCFYQPQYDSVHGAWEWAQKTLMDHARDRREHVYTKEQLENAKTADPLWNASQLEMVHHGKMHGFMRFSGMRNLPSAGDACFRYVLNNVGTYQVIEATSPSGGCSAVNSHLVIQICTNGSSQHSGTASMYWAKKILEWTSGPEEALAIAIYLNDKYELDGRDPNGYVGCMWSICGVHDQGWRERPIFGKIRYMNLAGCKRKFDVDGYIAHVKKLSSGSKKRKLGS